jgi:hypothetical protein
LIFSFKPNIFTSGILIGSKMFDDSTKEINIYTYKTFIKSSKGQLTIPLNEYLAANK